MATEQKLFGAAVFLSLFPHPHYLGEAFAKRQQSGHPGFFVPRSRCEAANDSTQTQARESAPNKYSLVVAHEKYRRPPAVLEFPAMRTGGRLGGEQILILGSTGPSRLVEFADLIHRTRQACDESILWHAG